MNRIRAFRLHSFAQYFCSLTVAILFVYSVPTNALTRSECDDLKPSDMTAKQQRECAKFSSTDSDCEEAKRNAKDALKDLNKACGDSGLGGSCISKVQACSNAGGEDEFSNDPDLLIAFSEALGIPQNQVGSSCPKYSGQGFMERKDKYDKDIETVNDDIKDTKEELADLQSDFTKDVQEVQEEIAEAQKDLKQKQLDIKKEQRERAAEQAKTAADLAQQIRSKQNSIMSKRQEIANLMRSKNSNMISLNFDTVKYKCLVETRKFSKDYSESTASGNPGSLITRASRKKKAVQNHYDTCMAQINEQRNAVIEQTDQKIEGAQKDIDDAQSDIDNMNQQLTSMQAQEAEAKNDENTAIQNESNALSEKITRATAKLQSLQQSTQQKDTALKEKLQKLNKRSTELSNSLTRLGTAPDDETSNVKMSQVVSAYDDYQAAVGQIPVRKADGELCNYNDPLSVGGAKGGSGSSGGGNSKSSNSSGKSKGSQ